MPGRVAALRQRVEHGREPRAWQVAAEHVGEADFAGFEPDSRARHRCLAEVEGRAVAAHAAAQHHEADLRRADLDEDRAADAIERLLELGGRGAGREAP